MPFTRRQAEILDRAARGLSDKEIARELGLSAHTVRSHLQRTYQVHGFANRSEAVAVYVAEQAPQPEPETVGVDAPRSRRDTRFALMGAVAGSILVLSAVGAWAASPRVVAMRPPAAAAAIEVAVSHDRATPAARPPATAPALATTATARPPTPAPARPTAAGPRASAAPPAQIQTLPATAQLDLINAQRSVAALPALAWNDCLGRVAAGEAQRLAAQGYLSAGGGIVADGACHAGLAPAEKLAVSTGGVNDALVNQGIAADPAGRALLLGPYRNLGAYWAVSASGSAFIAIELA